MTEFIMVRHGEPDYSVVEDWAGIAVAKNFAPLTELGLDVKVEHGLYEWQLDKTHSVRAKLREKILLWQFNHRKWNCFRKWEHPDTVKERVLKVFDKYLSYDKVIVSCHAMMILYTLGDEVPTQYGQIRRIRYDGNTLQEVQ